MTGIELINYWIGCAVLESTLLCYYKISFWSLNTFFFNEMCIAKRFEGKKWSSLFWINCCCQEDWNFSRVIVCEDNNIHEKTFFISFQSMTTLYRFQSMTIHGIERHHQFAVPLISALHRFPLHFILFLGRGSKYINDSWFLD